MKNALLMLAAVVIGTIAWSMVGAQAATPASPAPAASQPATGIILSRVVHDIDYRRAEPERLIVTLRVTPDPALHLAYVHKFIRAETAMDDKGHSLVLAGPIPADLRLNLLSLGGVVSELVQVVLQPPAPDVALGTKIQSLEGVIPAAVVVKTDTVDLTPPGNATRDYAGGVKGTFAATMTNATSCKIEYSFDIPAGLPEAERAAWVSQMPGLKTRVVDAAGEAWRQSGASSTGGSTTHFSRSQSFSPPPGRAAGAAPTVSIDVITQTRTMTIPFRLVDVPLP